MYVDGCKKIGMKCELATRLLP